MLKMIACISSDGGIGNKNKLLFQISEDMERFKRKTMGNTIVMGRKTWESLPKKPLPNRRNIVFSKTETVLEGAEVVQDINHILTLAETEDVYIIGGTEIYKMFLDEVSVIELTEIDGVYPADRYFPEIDVNKFKVTYLADMESGAYTGVFKTYERKIIT